MNAPFRVALLGFRSAEHGQLLDLLAPAARRAPAYEAASGAAGCDFVIVDADSAEGLAEVVRHGLLDRTVYIASQAPADTPAWLARPLAAPALLRQLDLLVVQHVGVQALEPSLELRELPAAPPPPAPVAAPQPAPPPSAAPPGPGSPRVLLVDDSEVALRYLESRLEPHGVLADRAASSGKALELLSQRDYGIVFVDVELGPGSELDGLALCQHVKRHRVHGGAAPPVVVMVSAHHSELDRARGELAGCDEYLAKPLDDAALHAVLVRHGAAPPPPKPQRPPRR